MASRLEEEVGSLLGERGRLQKEDVRHYVALTVAAKAQLVNQIAFQVRVVGISFPDTNHNQTLD